MKIKADVIWCKTESIDKDDFLLNVDDFEKGLLFFETDEISTINGSLHNITQEKIIVIRLKNGESFNVAWNKKLFDILTSDYKEIK